MTVGAIEEHAAAGHLRVCLTQACAASVLRTFLIFIPSKAILGGCEGSGKPTSPVKVRLF